MAITSIEVHLECDLCGDDLVIEVSEGFTDRDIEKQAVASDWTVDRSHGSPRHLCEGCTDGVADDDAEEADEDEDEDVEE